MAQTQAELERRIDELEKRIEHVVRELKNRGGVDVDHESN